MNFEADFDRYPTGTVIPHYDWTTNKAFSVEDGVGVFVIETGMHGAGAHDARRRVDRAELGVVVPYNQLIHQSFKFRLPSATRISTRFMISQVKMPSSGSHSPSVAVYVDRGGRVKCNNFDSFQKIRFINLPEGSIDDGDWHQVDIWIRFDEDNGYCRVDVDGITQIEEVDYRSVPPGGDRWGARARIGAYRDASLVDKVRIEYDDWTIDTVPVEEEQSM